MLFPRVQLLTAISLAILAGYVVGFIEGENYAYAPNVEASPILGTLLIFSLVCVAAWIYLAVEFDWGITKLKIPRTHSNPPEVTAALTELGKTRGADRLAILQHSSRHLTRPLTDLDAAIILEGINDKKRLEAIKLLQPRLAPNEVYDQLLYNLTPRQRDQALAIIRNKGQSERTRAWWEL